MGSRDRRGAPDGEQPSRAGRSLPSARETANRHTTISIRRPTPSSSDDPRSRTPASGRRPPASSSACARSARRSRPRRRPGPRGPVAGCPWTGPSTASNTVWRPTARSGRPRRAGTRSSTTFCPPPWPSRRSAAAAPAALQQPALSGGSSWIARARAIDSGVRRRSVGTGCASWYRRPPEATATAGAEVGLLDLGVGHQALGHVLGDLAGLQDVAALGDAQGHQRVLLDEEDGRPRGVDALTISKICSTRIGARPIDGSSSSSTFGRARRSADRQHLLLAARQRPPF